METSSVRENGTKEHGKDCWVLHFLKIEMKLTQVFIFMWSNSNFDNMKVGLDAEVTKIACWKKSGLPFSTEIGKTY